MNIWQDQYSHRELTAEPRDLTDGELVKAEQFTREETRRYPKARGALLRLEKIITEKEKRSF